MKCPTCGEWMLFRKYKNLGHMTITKFKCPNCDKTKEMVNRK